MSTRPSAPVAFPLPSLPAGVTGAVVVGCSGGLDSSVLLHRLAAEPSIRAHGLRAQAQHVNEVVEVAVLVQPVHRARQGQLVTFGQRGQRGRTQRARQVHVQIDLGQAPQQRFGDGSECDGGGRALRGRSKGWHGHPATIPGRRRGAQRRTVSRVMTAVL